MTDIRPGMAVHLVRMPERADELLCADVQLGDTGIVMGVIENSETPLWRIRFRRFGLDRFFVLGRESIQPTSPSGVTIHPPFVREEGFYWVKDRGRWIPGEWSNGGWFFALAEGFSCGEEDGYFDQIGPRLMPPEELK